jgi:hypothetical protein
MNVPGFTAEASVYSCVRHYHVVATSTHAGEIVPAMIGPGECYMRCVAVRGPSPGIHG